MITKNVVRPEVSPQSSFSNQSVTATTGIWYGPGRAVRRKPLILESIPWGYLRVCPYFLYKLLHKSLEATVKEGLSQTADYMDRVGTDEGYLIRLRSHPGGAVGRKDLCQARAV